MSTSSPKPFIESSELRWEEIWAKSFSHYQRDLRHAYYVQALLDDGDRALLEMGAGSFRDMALLNRLGVNCFGMDYSPKAVELAQRQFPDLASQIFHGDAFKLDGVADGAFDVSFHNGLWVYFNDNDIRRMAAEQARISRRKVIATVHNAHNADFIEYFARLSESDPLYRVRFFEVDEMRALLGSVCRSIEVFPVGKGKKYFEDLMINEGKTSRSEMRAYFNQAGMDNLECSERLLCVGHF